MSEAAATFGSWQLAEPESPSSFDWDGWLDNRCEEIRAWPSDPGLQEGIARDSAETMRTALRLGRVHRGYVTRGLRRLASALRAS